MPASDDKSDFDRLSNASRTEPFPDPPLLPEGLKNRHPELREAYEAYDQAWRDWAKKIQASK